MGKGREKGGGGECVSVCEYVAVLNNPLRKVSLVRR